MQREKSIMGCLSWYNNPSLQLGGRGWIWIENTRKLCFVALKPAIKQRTCSVRQPENEKVVRPVSERQENGGLIQFPLSARCATTENQQE